MTYLLMSKNTIMKNPFLVAVLVTVTFCGCKPTSVHDKTGETTNADNSRNSLDWAGIYRGMLPCADCSGVRTQIILNKDLTYEMALQYVGKGSGVIKSNGMLQWNGAGSIITLTGSREPNQYLVGEGKLFKLDMDGKRIQGDVAEQYVLKKEDNEIIEKYWKLVELRGKKVTPSEIQDREPHFILKELDRNVIGHGGCNSFHGVYELSTGNRIRFSKMASTLTACGNMELEREFLDVLEMADNYNVNGDTLQLNRARMAPLARFAAVYFR